MKQYPPLSIKDITSRLVVDITTGRAYWNCPPGNHMRLKGSEAGSNRPNHSNKQYCRIKFDRLPYLRSHIVFAVAHGRWPTGQVDHINGNSLDDRIANLREATPTQNAWNHHKRAKKSDLPMGVRASGNRFVARIAVNKKMLSLGGYASIEAAAHAYQSARKQHYGEFA